MQPLTVLLLTITVAEAQNFGGYSPVRWYDYGEGSIDTFFDRLVGIIDNSPNMTNRLYITQATGVFITSRLVLTSHNAFRKLSRTRSTLNYMYVAILIERTYYLHDNMNRVVYNMTYKKIDCAREVIPSQTSASMPSHILIKHGIHSPVHDLMVIRIDGSDIKFLKPIPKTLYSFDNIPNAYRGFSFRTGPIQTDLARPGDVLAENLTFASLGHHNDRHISRTRLIVPDKINTSDALTNCDEWFPRAWGHLLCFKNLDSFPGIASGAMLFSNNKLVGVGCFALFRANFSIIVFTDVRPYWHLFHRTCSRDDQNLVIPEDDGR